MHIKKQRLLTPGPTPLLPKALHAMLESDIHHRTEDFRAVYRAVLADLKEVLATTNDILPLVASGSGAMEAAVSNFFSPGDRVIVATAGKFGERWVEIAKAFGLDVTVLSAPYGKAVRSECVTAKLQSQLNIKGVFVQASETSTGVQHDVAAMGKAVAATDALFVVDAITGMGTMPLDIEGWGMDVVVGGSQKVFMVPPGLAFLAISEKAWARNATARLPRYYFDLKAERKSAATGESSWTPNTSMMLAMAEALRYIKTLGMDKLIENARLLALATRQAALALGLELFAPESPGSAVTTIRPPAGMDSGVIVNEFRKRFGAVLADGQGSMKGSLFRVAHLGYFDFADLFATIAQLELILLANGQRVVLGSGVAAAQRVYAEAAFGSQAEVAATV